MKNTTRKITYGALIIACAVVLPQLFHLSGIPNSGAVFLPMHIPVLLGGFILGPLFGALIGVLSPLISSLLTAMPAPARLPFMMIELAGYGFFAGLMYHTLGFSRKKLGTYISLISAMLFACRICRRDVAEHGEGGRHYGGRQCDGHRLCRHRDPVDVYPAACIRAAPCGHAGCIPAPRGRH